MVFWSIFGTVSTTYVLNVDMYLFQLLDLPIQACGFFLQQPVPDFRGVISKVFS